MFRSATFKLTMWYLAIVMTISIIFSCALFVVTTGELNRGIQRESERIELQFPVFNNDPHLVQVGSDLSNGTHRILLRLIALNLLVLVGAGYASYILARKTLQPIEAAHEQQKRFTSDVSHELRTPLTALRMESEVALLNPKSSTKELRDTLESNLEEITKLDTLINNLLRLTQLEADELQQHFQNIQSKEVVVSAIGQVAKIAQTRNITIDEDIKNVHLLGDKESLTQVLVILLDNALKYSEKGTHITVSARQSNNEAVWTIKDAGKGIEPAALEHVFDRFYREDKARNKSYKDGYGLGLSIAKMIVDIHNGNIVIQSRVGVGTTVSIHLPIASKDAALEPKQSSRQDTA